MIIDILMFTVGLILLYAGAEFLVRGSSQLAVMARINPLIVGVTVVAFGTSSPEFLVSFVAAWSGRIDVAVGNIVGSNIANIGLILGISALLIPIKTEDTKITKELFWMLGVSVLFWIFSINGILSQIEGFILFAGIIIFTFFLIKQTIKERNQNSGLKESKADLSILKKYSKKIRILVYIVMIIAGVAILVFGSELTINAATNIARALGVSEVIIGLSLVAFGTSLPELATAIISIIKKEKAILIGNIIGSNIFNILFVGGGVASVYAIPIQSRVSDIDIPIMLILSFVLVPFIFKFKKLSRISGLALMMFYVLYICFIYLNP